MNIIQKPSPNFGRGRNGFKPYMVVLHIMAGSLSGTDSWFASVQSQVSSHYGIGFKGEIHQYVQESDTAWANGRLYKPTAKLLKPSSINPNLYTISLEHEGQDLSKAPETQLNASASLIKDICGRYSIPIDRDHIIGHYEIYASKPNCPSTNKNIINNIISRALLIK